MLINEKAVFWNFDSFKGPKFKKMIKMVTYLMKCYMGLLCKSTIMICADARMHVESYWP